MDTLTRIRAFIDVVDAEGFSAAARRVGKSKALLSKYVRELEDELGALLLNRTTRQFSLTEAGHTYYKRASELVPWCRAEAERRFVAKGLTPYQWSASYHDRGKMLNVTGRLRVEGRDVDVRCSVVRGAREYDASIQIDDDRL